MDAKLETWELAIPAELRPGTTPEQDIIYFVGLSSLEIQKFNRHRYMISTWYLLTRLKLYTIAVKRLWDQPQSTTLQIESPGPPGPTRDTVPEKVVRFALELIKCQCDAFDRMRRTKASERWLGGNWYFEGCLSLFEAAVALLLVLTKLPTSFFIPPGANLTEKSKEGLKLDYDEMTRVISRVVDVFSEVVMSEREFDNGTGEVKEGRRTEIASKALDTLQELLKEHWWKLDPRAEQGKFLHNSPAQPSPRRTESSPATGMVGSGPGLSFGGTGYGGLNIGTMFPSQQQDQLPFRTQAQQIQTYSGLESSTSTETNPSPSSLQQQLHYQAQPVVYGSTAQYPMTTGAYPSSFAQPSFENLPLPVGNPPYSQYTQNQKLDPSTTVPPIGITRSSPYDYQPQDNFSILDTPSSYPTTPFPFPPISSQSSSQSLEQSQSSLYQSASPSRNQPPPQQYQQPQQQRVSEQHQPPRFSTPPDPSQPSPGQHPTPMAGTYAYNPSTSSSAVSSSGGRGSSASLRAVRSSPGVPPPSQGMKMIHYIAPGSTTTTTGSGMGVMGALPGGTIGTMSFSVSGMAPDSSRQQRQQSQQARIVLSEFMGRPHTPTGGGAESEEQSGGGASGGYYDKR
jgi:hypothetical protein